MAMITDVEDFFTKGCGRCERFGTPDCSTRLWIGGLLELRRICLDMGLQETVKWGHPCYMHAGRNITLFGAFRGDYRMHFMNGALLGDPEGILQPNGPNAQTRDVLYFKSNDDVLRLEPVIRAYLAESMGYAEKGIRAEKVERDLEMPDELIEALDADPELAEAYHNLTPGRQRSYIHNLNGAKQSATRVTRIEKFRDHIIAGKGALER